MTAPFTEYHAAERFAVPAARIWAILADLDHPGLSEGFVQSIEVEGDGIGAVRRFRLLPQMGGATVAERIVEFEPDEMRYAYQVFEFGPLPYAAFEGHLRVTEDGAAAATLQYRARFQPASPDGAAACLAEREATMGVFFRNLHRLLD
jgi:hypothetical protein